MSTLTFIRSRGLCRGLFSIRSGLLEASRGDRISCGEPNGDIECPALLSESLRISSVLLGVAILNSRPKCFIKQYDFNKTVNVYTTLYSKIQTRIACISRHVYCVFNCLVCPCLLYRIIGSLGIGHLSHNMQNKCMAALPKKIKLLCTRI